MKRIATLGCLLLAGCGTDPAPPAPTPSASLAAAPALSSSPAVIARDEQDIRYDPEGPLRIVGSETQYDIILPSDVLFDFDKATLRPEADVLLGKVRAHLAEHGSDQLHVRGYTDAKGNDAYNFTLSMNRAKAVCDWLKARGVPSANCIGRGEQDPVAPNARPDGSDDPVGRQANRRVTVSVVKYPDANAMIDAARRSAADGRAATRQ